jgi:hypothetical protein
LKIPKLKIARRLGLNKSLIIKDIISSEDAIAKGINLNTSMNTNKCRRMLKLLSETYEQDA